MANEWLLIAAAVALAAAGILGIAVHLRARAAKRWLRALNAFADREIAAQRRGSS